MLTLKRVPRNSTLICCAAFTAACAKRFARKKPSGCKTIFHCLAIRGPRWLTTKLSSTNSVALCLIYISSGTRRRRPLRMAAAITRRSLAKSRLL
ncbi:UNVERIFIED_CONTAM: hypothetical protein GTU68_035511 [Idotea baltica]|nr:hypothetical protein [Idotea baltica]